MKEFPRKFLSLRDKNGTHRRNRSIPPVPVPGNKPRPLSAEAFLSMFKNDHSRQNAKAGAEEEKDAARIEEVLRRLDELNITDVSADHITDIMATDYAEGDPERTVQFIDIEQKSASGVVIPYDPNIEMVGAENRGNVTCYLDALLFAMFSKLTAFECMLNNEFPPEDSRHKLVTLLRLWVNMLRTGKLVHTDLTALIQDALADCGWSDARMLEQQDTSEAFAFITETLQLPLLSLQVDLFHQGKRDKDDHKVVYERLLNLAVPPDPEDKGIKLEDCLEEYFNAQVDVQRDSEEAKKSGLEYRNHRSHSEAPTLVHRDTIRLITEELGEASTPVTASPVSILPAQEVLPDVNETIAANPHTDGHEHKENGNIDVHVSTAETKPTIRHRSTSVIQRVLLDEQGRPSSPDNTTKLQKAMRKGSTVVKAVTIPAWQFFKLIPWHAVTNSEPRNDVEVAMSFDKRPVVGICLKRYAMTQYGQPKRHNTFIDIPDSLRLPHFMADEPKPEDDPNLLNTDYKLVLQSVICHRGDSLQSGHYIAFARVAPKVLTGNRRHDFDPPPDYEQAQWVRFDDLQIESRVTYVDDIKEALKSEMPYLLFYQVMPMVEVSAPSVDETETEPPSYNDSRISIELPPTPTRFDRNQLGLPGLEESYFDSAPNAPFQRTRSKPPSIRLSSDSERPSRSRRSVDGTDADPYSGSLLGESRRPSVNWTESTGITPAVTPGSHSPAVTPLEESTSSRLSRAASRFAKGSRSRPTSQSGDNRISFSMARLGGLMRPSKEPLVEPNPQPNTLAASSTNSTGPLTSEISKEAEEAPDAVEVEAPHPSHHHHGHKHTHSHKRVRSKEKNPKTNKSSSTQPERECTVM
ncbi:hypothetical protein G7046_g5524 [Stylonectria norvegica]|nr:hypothetical protein G7046_g5524 [Stylonectria norvegica]